MTKKLNVGELAPKFWERSVKGEIVNLDDFTGSYTLIAFLRYAGCPWCNLAIHRLTLENTLLNQSRCNVIAFVQSSKDNIIKNIYDQHAKAPEFSVIADQESEIYKKYGVVPTLARGIKQLKSIPHWVEAVKEEGYKQKNVDGNLFLAPAMFLLDENLRIIRVDYNSNLYEHETFTEIYDTLAARG